MSSKVFTLMPIKPQTTGSC